MSVFSIKVSSRNTEHVHPYCVRSSTWTHDVPMLHASRNHTFTNCSASFVVAAALCGEMLIVACWLHLIHVSCSPDEVRAMGAKAKYDKLAGALNWNMRSELKKTYGTLSVVLTGLREVFFDPHRLYLKRALDGVVEWFVGADTPASLHV